MVRLYSADLIDQDASGGEHCGQSQQTTLQSLTGCKKSLGTVPVSQLICEQRGKLWRSLLPLVGFLRFT